MQSRPSVLLCGATGLVGRECLRLLATDPTFGRIVVLTRRPLAHAFGDGARDPPIEEHVVNFDRLHEHPGLFAVDQVICALGTTIRQAGSQQRFREVDFGYPLTIAQLAVARGARHFLLVSAIGASATSQVFYNRVKGELEDAVRALPYRRVTIVRPSLLLGEREERRIGESIGKRLSFLFPRKYKPVTGVQVAAALLAVAHDGGAGLRIIESAGIPALAEAYLGSR